VPGSDPTVQAVPATARSGASRRVQPGIPPEQPEVFDEGLVSGLGASDSDRRVRRCVADFDLRELRDAVARDLDRRNVCFGTVDGRMPFRVDPIPRLIDADDWQRLAAGLSQRVRALELFTRDVYGERLIVDAGVVPARAIESSRHFEPALMGMGGEVVTWASVAGLDVVRDRDGAFRVLEDNLRTPSGIAYAVAAREVLSAYLRPPRDLRPRSLDGAFQTLGNALRAAAPPAAGADPSIVLLTDGEHNSAFYEHAAIARALGLALVLPEQLSVRRGRLLVRLDRAERPVDVLYRRTDEDRLVDEEGRPTELAQLLLEPVRRGTLACVNAFGAGVGDDKLLHAYVEQMVRFYLGEEPLLGSVATYDPAQPETLAMILERLDELVIKPRSGHGGYGVVIGAHAKREDLEETAAALRASPEEFIAQEMVMLSRHPTVTDGALEPRHIDLRAFVITSGEDVQVLPGGLTRVAFERGTLVVNSSQNGGSKDTWVLE